ncbi:hypothetical protein [Agrobacterium pusense]|uniref:hypothetical protein n=1 Tax=Agrobacterium pusense TaxID=648995 RepID=UPI00087F351B|nr:hypothetical protein [Agrobacterium pusense]WKD44357.1 hypothetical protein M8C82_01780 [Agrobacterium pusense]SDF62460.1 hypothetical protein SAMN05421750_11917 [Agrobacterium pusense]
MTKKTTKAASGRFDYGAAAIDAQSMKALEATASNIQALGRRSTEQAFELGDLLEQASELVEPGTFEKWVSQRCDISSKTARNYRSVARNLAPYRTRAVELAVSPTVLFHLASAPDEKVETALAFAEENDGIRVSEVKALLADGSEAASEEVTATELPDVGGLSGLRALIDMKTKSGVAAFVENAAMLAKTVEDILQSKPRGKRLQKKALVPVLEPLGRLAKRSLGNILLLDAPGDIDVRKLSATELAPGSCWHRVFETLDDVGDREAWPEAKELELWLSQELLPLLEWATSRTKQPEWPLQAAVASNSPDKVMHSGLEALGGVERVDAPSLDPSEDDDEALEDYVPPAMFTRSGGTSETVGSNVLSFGSTEGMSGVRKPRALSRKPAEASAD